MLWHTVFTWPHNREKGKILTYEFWIIYSCVFELISQLTIDLFHLNSYIGHCCGTENNIPISYWSDHLIFRVFFSWAEHFFRLRLISFFLVRRWPKYFFIKLLTRIFLSQKFICTLYPDWYHKVHPRALSLQKCPGGCQVCFFAKMLVYPLVC